MIQIYGPAGSSAGRCYWALEEAGLAYEVKPIDFRAADHKKPEYLAMNPNGKVPLLVDGNLRLWESMAINFYIAEKYKPVLLGKSLEEKAHILKWSFWSLAEYQKPMIDVFIQKVFVPAERRDQSIIDKGLKALEPLHVLLNNHLKDQSFMVGQDFTLADINVATVAKLTRDIGVELTPYPAIQSWLSRVLERPAALKVAELEAH